MMATGSHAETTWGVCWAPDSLGVKSRHRVPGAPGCRPRGRPGRAAGLLSVQHWGAGRRPRTLAPWPPGSAFSYSKNSFSSYLFIEHLRFYILVTSVIITFTSLSWLRGYESLKIHIKSFVSPGTEHSVCFRQCFE